MESSDEEKDSNFDASTSKNVVHSSSYSGKKFVINILKGTDENFLEKFRMDKHVFHKFCDLLRTRGLLHHTNRIKIEEQFAIFMFIVGHNLRTREVQELFKYSGETISRHFNNVLNAITTISVDFFQPPKSDVPPEIREDPRFYPYFMNCVGAVDGIHFPVTVGIDEQVPFQNENGFISQNVLAACSFDMKFHYVLAGWEGSAPHMRVLNSALSRRKKLEVPEGKYYLVSSKYSNLPSFVSPYPFEFGGGGSHPRNAQDLFNDRHSILCNVTSRTFAALKERFPILMAAPSYPLPTQVNLVVAACALHNYIRRENPQDWIFQKYEQENVFFRVEHRTPTLETEDTILVGSKDLGRALNERDAIANEIWSDYIRDYESGDDEM